MPGLKKLYNLDFKSFRALDTGGPLTVQALKNGQVDAADLFTTDPSIAANSFVILDDPKHLFAAQNVVPLVTKAKEVTERARRAVEQLHAAGIAFSITSGRPPRGLISLTKAAIIRQGVELGVDHAGTTSCYDPVVLADADADADEPAWAACGRCDACVLRLRGFNTAGLTDPARYVSPAARR